MMAAVTAPATCPMCRHEGEAGARYCERCGLDLAGVAARTHVLTSNDSGDVLDLGAVAGRTDIGRYRDRNEDALAIGTIPDVLAAVVCDGVSTSGRPELAAGAAVLAGIDAVLASLAAGAPPETATRDGGLAAARAAAGTADQVPGGNPPATTYVSAVVTRDQVVIGWVGDSPAYWIGPGVPPRRLTIDDSAAGRLEAAGVPHDDPRYAIPHIHALDRWLGADSPGGAPKVTTLTPRTAGVVLVCSDGLILDPPELADALGRQPVEAARDLLERALEAGSRDNVTVALIEYAGPP
jgi:PPM family protein phosphatase